VFAADIDPQVIGTHGEVCAPGEKTDIAGRSFAATDILTEAVPLVPHGGNSKRDIVSRANIQGGNTPEMAELAHGNVEIARWHRVKPRLGRPNENGASSRVLSRQGALRSPQNLDGSDVEERLSDEEVLRNRLPVHVEGDTGRGRGRRDRNAHASDVYVGRPIEGIDSNRWSNLLHIDQVGGTARSQILAGQYGCRDGNVLQVLRSPFSGDRYLLQSGRSLAAFDIRGLVGEIVLR